MITPKHSTLAAPQTPKLPAACFGRGLGLDNYLTSPVAMTPDRRCKAAVFTPPPAPCAMFKQREQEDDVKSALCCGSVPSMKLSLLLLNRCQCGIDHCLHEAVSCQNLPALRFLLERGATETLNKPCCGERPLHRAIRVTRNLGDIGYEMSRCLLEHGAVLDAFDTDGPLHEAVVCVSPAGVALLLAHGANPNATNANGQTALHVACSRTMFSSYQLQDQVLVALLKNGADPLIRDGRGCLPSDYADCSVLPIFKNNGDQLRARLARAERLWIRRPVMSLRSSGKESQFGCKMTDDLFRAVVDFL